MKRFFNRLAEGLRQHENTVRFCTKFGVYAIIAFSAIYALNDLVVEPFTRGLAWVAYALAKAFGSPVSVDGISLSMPNFTVRIRNNCNAAYEIGLYSAAALAYPTSMSRRLKGILFAAAVLYVVNLIRVLSLLYTGYLFPAFIFEAAHVYVWQILFVLLIGALWLSWIGRLRQVA